MKKLIALLICLTLAAVPALCEENSDGRERSAEEAPWPGTDPDSTLPASSDGITLTFDGQEVRLSFDPQPQYSSHQGGMIQASFYGYGADGITMYELYINFPDTVKPGMRITPEYEAITNGEASVSLIVSRGEEDMVYYYSSLSEGSVYPSGSDFSIAIDDISESGESARYTGTLSATLVATDPLSGDAAASLVISQTPFSFTMDGGYSQAPVPSKTDAPQDLRIV